MRRGWLLVLAWVTAAAFAHKAQLTETEIVVSPADLRIEVSHAVHLDDAMPLLASLGDPRGRLAPETQVRLFLYLEDRFALSAGERMIRLEPVGAELDGDTLWIYQEGVLTPERLAALSDRAHVWNRVMHDRDLETQNLINLRLDRAVRSVTLTPDRPTASI